MSIRRLFAAAIAVAWLLPAAMAGAIALHVAFEHHGGEAGGARSHRADLLEVAEHGHAHAASDAPHQHSAVVGSAGAAARRTLDSTSISSRSVATGAGWVPALDGALEHRARAHFEPSKASGPPLLARLSTLRI